MVAVVGRDLWRHLVLPLPKQGHLQQVAQDHALVMGLGRSGWWLDLMTLKIFSNLDDSMIPCPRSF